LRTPFQIQKAVVFSLFIRELKTRFSRYRIGYLWALLQPTIQILFFYGLFSILHRSTFAEIELPMFLITGIMPWLFFNQMILRSVSAVSSNAGLFSFRHVKPLDTLISRTLLESVISISTYIILILFCGYLGFNIAIEHPLSLILLWMLFIVFCFACSIIIMILLNRFTELDKVISVVMRTMYFVSGIFYTLESLPPAGRAVIQFNPLIHFIELFRSYYFSSFEAPLASLPFISMMTMIILFLGLATYRVFRIKLVQS
jgi:capsular polysaccharide transport system permease protein